MIAVVEDHRLVANLVTTMIEGAGHTVVDAFAPAAASIVANLADVRPALTLLDHDLGSAGHGIDVLAAAAEHGAVVVVTASDDRLIHARYLEAGAAGVVPKSAGPSDLLAAIELVEAGEPVTPTPVREELLAELRSARSSRDRQLRPFAALTRREAETLVALGDGQSAGDIAEAWVVSLATVRSHIRSILVKLGVGSQLEAVAMAHRAGWFGQGATESPILMMTAEPTDSTMTRYERKTAG